MSDLWINIRFGIRHLQIGPDGVELRVNPYHLEVEPERWLEVFQLFGWHKR